MNFAELIFVESKFNEKFSKVHESSTVHFHGEFGGVNPRTDTKVRQNSSKFVFSSLLDGASRHAPRRRPAGINVATHK